MGIDSIEKLAERFYGSFEKPQSASALTASGESDHFGEKLQSQHAGKQCIGVSRENFSHRIHEKEVEPAAA